MSTGSQEDELMVDSVEGGIVVPGDLVTDDVIWMRGHGTYAIGENTYSSVAGTVEQVNKLLSVRALRGRYVPVIGDHVVGRVTAVVDRRWRVDIGASQDAVLQLGSINLPGGILRRKSDDDELQMREFLKEGDLLNAEVQSLYQDGAAALHTRSLRYGKLRNGFFCTVPSPLILRLRSRLFRLEGGVEMILGANGYIWLRKDTQTDADVLAKTRSSQPGDKGVSITKLEAETDADKIYSDINDVVSVSIRQNISRYANCLAAFEAEDIGINEARIKAMYEASLAYSNAAAILEPDVRKLLVKATLDA